MIKIENDMVKPNKVCMYDQHKSGSIQIYVDISPGDDGCGGSSCSSGRRVCC